MQLSDVAFKQKLVSVMKDNKYDRWVGGKRTGKLDGKRLYKINQSDRVFKKMQERKGKAYNVSLLIDSSGSMNTGHGGRDRTAIAACDKLAKGFEAAGVNVEIYGFNTLDWKLKGFTEKYQGLDKFSKRVLQLTGSDRYGEPEDCYFLVTRDNVIKNYDKNNPDALQAHHTAQGNCDGKTIRDAVTRIKNKEGTNIIIVLSDGKPHFDIGMGYLVENGRGKKYSDYDLKGEVDAAIRAGITFIGVGIQSEYVKQYYPAQNTIIVNKMEELYPGVINKLDRLLKRG